jgi:leucyl-tRNA synthetase
VNWPESIKALQRNWIGKSEGAEVDFFIGAPVFSRTAGGARDTRGASSAAKHSSTTHLQKRHNSL